MGKMKNREAKIFMALILTVVVLTGIIVICNGRAGENSLPANATGEFVEQSTEEQITEPVEVTVTIFHFATRMLPLLFRLLMLPL